MEIWNAKVSRAFAIMGSREHSDFAADDELDEIRSIAPYYRNTESYKQEALEYLNKMLPDMSSSDKKVAAGSYIYKCIICHRHFPTWWISKREWKTSLIGFLERAMEKFECDIDDRTMLCKECFEEIQRETAADPPRYFTINQYITYRLAHTIHGDLTEQKRILEQIWDLPAAYHTAEHPASTAQDSR